AASRADRFNVQPENNRYYQLKEQRPALMAKYIAEGKMDDPARKYRLEDARDFVGECPDMCPEYERHEREFQKGLMDFMQIPDTEKVDHARAVKRYRRSAADDEQPLPCDVRPPAVLNRTLDYLIHDLLPQYDLQRTYGFIRDRMRAIRKDITLQNLRGPEAVSLFERIARYHLMCSQALCEKIDIKQEYEQLGKTLQSLIEFYDDLREHGQEMPNEAEFRAYYLLHHAFNPDVQSAMENKFRGTAFMLHPSIQLALKLRGLMPRLDLHHDDDDDDGMDNAELAGEGRMEAYATFFNILEDPQTPYLLACAAHPHFIVVRRYAFKHMNAAIYVFPGTPDTWTSLTSLVHRLGYDNQQDAQIDIDYYEIPTAELDGEVYASIGKVKQVGADGKSQMVPGKFIGEARAADVRSDLFYGHDAYSFTN
ncbi:SAC3/GANP/Nin1/mts3/eIF-3 p25 family-domain-containing protein, partial [Fimicolochytrium jonesii]|uniref:SAC3/GANP/Nin1/mts3/eIF-3 p25 family-domain-containing protein n=1 Tax=Fimicolochytrium jonesii TaxID=1396493 RepID=UPI0022FE5720